MEKFVRILLEQFSFFLEIWKYFCAFQLTPSFLSTNGPVLPFRFLLSSNLGFRGERFDFFFF